MTNYSQARHWFFSAIVGAILTLIAGHTASEMASATPWVTVFENDRITVEQQDRPGKKYPRYRASTVLNTSIPAALGIITNEKRFPEWMPGCSESRLLDYATDGSRIVYHRNQPGWPIRDRDVITRTRTHQQQMPLQARVEYESINDPRYPPQEDLVRLPHLKGSYQLFQLSKTQTMLIYTMEMTPGGLAPAWVIRRSLQQIPYKTLHGLRHMLYNRSQ